MNGLTPKTYTTDRGRIAYWVTEQPNQRQPWLVFLPGLTADHRLFDRQVEYFAAKANLLVWDAPNHGLSRPFALDWTLDDKARWLKGILDAERIEHPVLVGQSMGGYVSQAFMDLFPGVACGFVSVDSCPLQRSYYAAWELAALRHTKLMFQAFPWNVLVNLGAKGNLTTEYGQAIMHVMMRNYRKSEYCDLSAHGFRVLAEAVEADRPYQIDCPFLILCGEKDGAGSARRYNRAWEERTGNPIHWIPNAGHNSTCDNPEFVNAAIENFLDDLT
ncbi:alpha/beta fold hydrolase [Anaerotardibacter muris]|uniref:alpha/beta fold hydrolase n=1 Tax=Anaerotardibacter muris TaxID=2941505 RepID=UPI002041A241|nr:alpha/beta hydrolase [Anaerotardibacter muris]